MGRIAKSSTAQRSLPPASVMLAVTVNVPEVNLPGCRVRPLLTSAAVRFTVEELKTVLSSLSVIVAPFAKPLIVTVVLARSSASPPATLIDNGTEAVPLVHFTDDGPDSIGAVATSLTVTGCGAFTVAVLPA